jgi:hypothetical protein
MVITMKEQNSKEMSMQFGLLMSLTLITVAVLTLNQSGDSTTPKQKNSTHQLIVRQWEV